QTLKLCFGFNAITYTSILNGFFPVDLIMAFRSNQMFKKIIKKVKEETMAPGVKESLKKFIPDNKISEDGGNKSRRTWKPNVQEKRLFSYIHDRHIRVKVTTHALRRIDKAGGIDEYLLKTSYHKMDTEMGLYWKAEMEKKYEELGKMDVVLFSPEDEANF
ncbi:Ribosomal l28 family, partial [Thalictrum thalictroides]